jgi:glycosyltransferase involved in cell wall biosynthesis
MNVLFVTWDGPQTNYLQGLFLPIFKLLSDKGYNFSVLQFTWGDEDKLENNHSLCSQLDINYKSVNVLRKPNVAIGSVLSAVLGKNHILRMVKKYNIDVVMPRSTLPALSTMLAMKSGKFKSIFDADGLPLDERVDFANTDPTSLVHRIMRDIEQQMVIRAGAIVTRSRIATEILQHRAGSGTCPDKFFEVANGRSQLLFNAGNTQERLRIRGKLGIENNAPLIVYAGSLGPQYCIDEMLLFYRRVKATIPSTMLLVLSGEHSLFQTIAGKDSSIHYKTVNAEEVPKYLACSDVGLAIRDQSFSMQGVAPIKLGEYLMCGIPVIASKGIGDTSMLTKQTGYLLEDNSKESITIAADTFVINYLNNFYNRDNINAIGTERFSLQSTVIKYHKALSSLQ